MSSSSTAYLSLITVRPLTGAADVERWNTLMRTHHYLATSNLMGEQIRYVAEHCGQWVALLGWSSASLKLQDRDAWIGWTPAMARQRLQLVANNARFLVLPGFDRPNLASRCLGLNVRRLSDDWKERYGHPILCAETFVELNRNTGACYRASGWDEVGETKGFRRTPSAYREHGITKRIFVREVTRHGRKHLGSRQDLTWDRPLQRLELAAQPVESPTPDAHTGLFSIIQEHITDPRNVRGRSYRLECLLGVILTGLLAGQTTCAAIAEWASHLKPHERKRLRCPYRAKTGYSAPTANTLRYILQDIKPGQLEAAVRAWLRACGVNTTNTHIAIDGKILCGSGVLFDTARAHLSAYDAHRDMVVDQVSIPPRGSEITEVRGLLHHMDITDTVITCDAAHTNNETATVIVEKKGSTCLPLKEINLAFWLPPRARLPKTRL